MLAAIRVEYAKSKARAERWEEERVLVHEEMRRCIAYFEWRADWWHSQERRREDLDPEVLRGLSAYACKQATFQKRLATEFARKWGPYLKRNGFDHSWSQKYCLGLPDEDDEDSDKETQKRQRISDKLKAMARGHVDSLHNDSDDDESDGFSD